MSPERPFPAADQQRSILKAFCGWAEHETGVEAVLLVGSHARRCARADSDVDLVIITAIPDHYVSDTGWLELCGSIAHLAVEDYGALRSVRVHFTGGAEFEFGFTSDNWSATDPVDPGTRQVVVDGSVVLVDKKGRLRRLKAAVHDDSDAKAPPTDSRVLTTARLRLRPWRAEDLEPFAALNADPRVREFFPSLQTYQESADSMEHIRNHFQEHGFGLWAVEVVGGDPFIGFIGLSVPSFDALFMPCVELGYRLAFESWGHGYATEGSQAALAFGFRTVGIPEVVAMTAVANQRSRRVMERLGMRCNPADDFEHPNVVGGHPLRRHVLYRLVAREWAVGQS